MKLLRFAGGLVVACLMLLPVSQPAYAACTLTNGAINTGAVTATAQYELLQQLCDGGVNASDVIDVDLTLDTSAYGDGDVLADFQAVTNFVRVNGGRALIQSITVLDKDDQGASMDIFITPNNVSLGTENSAPNISDANSEGMQRIVRFDTSEYVDNGGSKMATRTGIGLMVEAGSGTTTMYIGAITRGTPTYTATGLRLRIGLIWF